MQSKVSGHNSVLLGTGRAEQAEPQASIPEPVRSAVGEPKPAVCRAAWRGQQRR